MRMTKEMFETACTKIVFLISTGLFLALSFWALKYSHRYSSDYSSERIYGVFDSVWPNLGVLLLILVLFYVLRLFVCRGTIEEQKKKVKLFLAADMVLAGVFGVIWVTGCHIMPSDDQLQVYLTAVEFTQGIYRDMDAYFYMCPQQYGLAFLYECILWIWESYHLVQYINIVFLLMILYFGYKVSDCLFGNSKINLYTILVMNLFLPLTLYVNFVYGEMGTVAMSMCSIWGVLRWMESGKKRYGALTVMATVFAWMVRLNMIIVTIALAIILVLFAFRKKNLKALGLILLLFTIPFGCIRLVEFSYELRSGKEVGDGIPTMVNVAMGMQQSWQGAGAYNAYNHQTFWAAEGDSDMAARMGKDYIRNRLEEFKADPGMARYFYQSKVWEQWNEGSYGSLIMTADFEAAPFPLAQEIYGGKLQQPLVNWMERYLFVIYGVGLIYSLYGLLFWKDIEESILPMIVIGGMIFSLLWESKARYVFPYVVIFLPAVAAGLYFCQTGIERGFIRLKRKLRHRR